ncbi:hypothetical protein JW823_00540 [bacterium]|nr:hypothetical protein [candidate division CSSED10-310 bacterium]
MKKYSGLIVCMLTLGLTPNGIAQLDLPEWEPGFNWAILTYLDVNMKDPESTDQIDMIIEDDAPDYQCRSMETRQLTRGEMKEYNVYRLVYAGMVSGEGIADVDLFDMEIPIELRNGTQTGEMWVDTETLGTVYNSRFITADLWADYLFSWRQVGTIEIAFTEEYEPARDCIRFPVEVGNQWSEAMTLFFYGRYYITYDIGSGPQTMEDTFDDFVLFNIDFDVMTMESYKTWNVIRIEGSGAEWDGSLLARYADIARNYAFFSMTDLEMPDQGLLLRELRMDLMDFDLTAFPTPTPSPTPDPAQSGTTLHLNSDSFSRGDTFRLSRTLVNAGSSINVDEFILLDVYGAFWFWPEWTESITWRQRVLDTGSIYPDEVVLTFVWPDVDGSAEDLRFWAALLDHDSRELFGVYDVVTWAYR